MVFKLINFIAKLFISDFYFSINTFKQDSKKDYNKFILHVNKLFTIL